MTSSESSEIESFFRIVQIFSRRLAPFATNFWIFLQPNAALPNEGKLDLCALALPRLIYGEKYNDDILGRHIDLFWKGRGQSEKRLDYVARRLRVRVSHGCLHVHKNNGNYYLCVNFSSDAKTEGIQQSAGLKLVPPWLDRAVEIFTMHRGLLHDEGLLVRAVEKCIEDSAFDHSRVPVTSLNTVGGGGGGGPSTNLLHVDCSAPPASDEAAALISPDDLSTTHKSSGLGASASLQLASVVSPNNATSPQDLHRENQALIAQYNKSQYSVKDIPPSNVEKRAAAHILKRCEAERKEAGRIQLPSLKGQPTGSVSYAKLPSRREGNKETHRILWIRWPC